MAALCAAMVSGTASAADDARLLSLSCSGCHSPAARVADSQIPDLSRLSVAQLEAKLLAFRLDSVETLGDNSPTTVMNRIAKGYTPEQLTLLAQALGQRD